MSTWIPPVVPSAVEALWLPTTPADSSTDPYLISCLEIALEKRREDIRSAPAPVPTGMPSFSFRPALGADANAGHIVAATREEVDQDEEMQEAGEDPDDDFASDELSEDGRFGQIGEGSGGSRGIGADSMEEGSDADGDVDSLDEDDDDGLAGYL